MGHFVTLLQAAAFGTNYIVLFVAFLLLMRPLPSRIEVWAPLVDSEPEELGFPEVDSASSSSALTNDSM